jgi:hypothetical protein
MFNSHLKHRNQTAANRITLNRTVHPQMKAWIAKSCEKCALLRYYTV